MLSLLLLLFLAAPLILDKAASNDSKIAARNPSHLSACHHAVRQACVSFEVGDKVVYSDQYGIEEPGVIVTKYANDGGYDFRADGLVQMVDTSDLVLDEAASVSVKCMSSVSQGPFMWVALNIFYSAYRTASPHYKLPTCETVPLHVVREAGRYFAAPKTNRQARLLVLLSPHIYKRVVSGL